MIRSLWTWSAVGVCALAAFARAQDAPPPALETPVPAGATEAGLDAPPAPTLESAPEEEMPKRPAPGLEPAPVVETAPAIETAPALPVAPPADLEPGVAAPSLTPNEFIDGPRPLSGPVAPIVYGETYPHVHTAYDVVAPPYDAGFYGMGGYGVSGYGYGSVGYGGDCSGMCGGYGGAIAGCGGAGWTGYMYSALPALDGIYNLSPPLYRGPGDRYDILNLPPPGGMYNAYGRIVPGSEAQRLQYPRVVHAILIGGTADSDLAAIVDPSLQSIQTALGYLPKVKVNAVSFTGPDANNATIFDYIKGLHTTHEDAIFVYYAGPGGSRLPEGQILLPAATGVGQPGQTLLRSDIPRLLKMKHHRLAVFISDAVSEALPAPADLAPYEPTAPAELYAATTPPAIVPLLLLNSGFYDLSTTSFNPYAQEQQVGYGVAGRGSLAATTFAGLASSLTASKNADGFVSWDAFISQWQAATSDQFATLRADGRSAGPTFQSYRP